MLKKAGIITAVAAAGAIALTPFAFANGSHHEAPVTEYSNVEDGNLGNDCAFAQDGAEVTTDARGGDSLLGAAGAVVNGPIAPVSAPVQTLNCTNLGVSDVIDTNSGNTTRTAERTEVVDSYNVDGTVED